MELVEIGSMKMVKKFFHLVHGEPCLVRDGMREQKQEVGFTEI